MGTGTVYSRCSWREMIILESVENRGGGESTGEWNKSRQFKNGDDRRWEMFASVCILNTKKVR